MLGVANSAFHLHETRQGPSGRQPPRAVAEGVIHGGPGQAKGAWNLSGLDARPGATFFAPGVDPGQYLRYVKKRAFPATAFPWPDHRRSPPTGFLLIILGGQSSIIRWRKRSGIQW